MVTDSVKNSNLLRLLDTKEYLLKEIDVLDAKVRSLNTRILNYCHHPMMLAKTSHYSGIPNETNFWDECSICEFKTNSRKRLGYFE